jgi:hypothetical protein
MDDRLTKLREQVIANASRCRLSATQLAEIELAKREVRDGKIATDAEMAEVWRRFRS